MVRTILGTVAAWVCLGTMIGAAQTMRQEPASQKPFFDARNHQTQYAGPGREDPAPADISEVRIGYFGPSDPAHPRGGDMWSAAQMAVREANARGGYRGKPFRLVPAWSENPWGTGVAQVARMVYKERVWAIIGGIDGPSTHLAEQVVAKARLVLLGPASTDKTVNLANVPWMFSCVPGDHLQAPVLAAETSARAGQKPFVLLSATDHDSHLFTVELEKCLAKHRMVPFLRFECEPAAQNVSELARRVAASPAGAAVLIAGADDSARLVVALRGEGFRGDVFGGPAMGQRRFLEEAEAGAEGVVFPLLYHGDGPGGCEAKPAQSPSRKFAEEFRSLHGRSPDYLAAHTYDAVGMLIAAIDKAGLNRARIRDALADVSPWAGVTGTITWDSLGANARSVRLGTVNDGRLIFVSGPRAPGASTSR
ncbi:MAG: hypothetical protein A2V70_16405 [Planctomycetes bacterium RBG_13_63_9]|nr:MAG: hypothetical protein A2V70_16405 [Planctomycetes bacterium RBG_13_63_9]